MLGFSESIHFEENRQAKRKCKWSKSKNFVSLNEEKKKTKEGKTEIWNLAYFVRGTHDTMNSYVKCELFRPSRLEICNKVIKWKSKYRTHSHNQCIRMLYALYVYSFCTANKNSQRNKIHTTKSFGFNISFSIIRDIFSIKIAPAWIIWSLLLCDVHVFDFSANLYNLYARNLADRSKKKKKKKKPNES